jgi:hypothetical protein
MIRARLYGLLTKVEMLAATVEERPFRACPELVEGAA